MAHNMHKFGMEGLGAPLRCLNTVLKVHMLARSLHTHAHGTNSSGGGIDIDKFLDCGVAAPAAPASCVLAVDRDSSEY